MTDFLLLTLYAPLASWGDIAVGEFRGSWDRPSRSAVLGLVAGALGLEREAQEAHDALDAGYGVAVRVDDAGAPLVDYHTAQTVDAATVRKQRPRTRAELLAVGERQTVLSRRTYRQDALATVGLWARHGDVRWPLTTLRDELRRPRFAPYAGRRSNPLGLPLDPRIVPADDLAGAFAGYDARRSNPHTALDDDARAPWTHVADEAEVSHDPCDGFPSGLRALRREVRRDAGAHRVRWQFAERVVDVGVMPRTSRAGGDT